MKNVKERITARIKELENAIANSDDRAERLMYSSEKYGLQEAMTFIVESEVGL